MSDDKLDPRVVRSLMMATSIFGIIPVALLLIVIWSGMVWGMLYLLQWMTS